MHRKDSDDDKSDENMNTSSNKFSEIDGNINPCIMDRDIMLENSSVAGAQLQYDPYVNIHI